MKSFFVAFTVLGCALSSAIAQQSPCEFPNPGDGGVLDANGGYKPGSVFPWVDVANNAKTYADEEGVDILEYVWIDASNQFDGFMIDGNIDKSFEMLWQACNSFKALVPHIITNEALKARFAKVFDEFSAKLETKNIPEINQYMIDEYPEFRIDLGCSPYDAEE